MLLPRSELLHARCARTAERWCTRAGESCASHSSGPLPGVQCKAYMIYAISQYRRGVPAFAPVAAENSCSHARHTAHTRHAAAGSKACEWKGRSPRVHWKPLSGLEPLCPRPPTVLGTSRSGRRSSAQKHSRFGGSRAFLSPPPQEQPAGAVRMQKTWHGLHGDHTATCTAHSGATKATISATCIRTHPDCFYYRSTGHQDEPSRICTGSF